MSPDVLIIGGGAIGLSAAFRLARDGARVRLLEKSALGAGASGSTAALLEFQTDTDRDPHLFRLAQISRGLFSALESEVRRLTGRGFSLETGGILQVVSTETEASALRQRVNAYQSAGLRAEWMDAERLAAVHPWLKRGFLGGAWFGEDGQIDADAYLSTLARAARRAGAEIIEQAGDVVLAAGASGPVARSTDGREWAAEVFVVAAGAWSGAVVQPLGVNLPFRPVRGQLALYAPPAVEVPIPVCASNGTYLAPKRANLIVGATVEHVGFDAAPTEEGRAMLDKTARRFLPDGDALSLRRVVAGLRPGTPDLLPMIGFLRGHDRVLIAGGHYRNGMLLAPATAQAVSDLVFHRPPPMDLSPFRPDRFLVPEIR